MKSNTPRTRGQGATRRKFLAGSAVAGASLAIGCDPGSSGDAGPGAPRPADVASMRESHFAWLVGESFTLYVAGGKNMQVTLVDEKPLGKSYPGSPRAPFGLYFRGSGIAELKQGTYDLEHPSVGRHGLFFVPVGAGRTELEALFT